MTWVTDGGSGGYLRKVGTKWSGVLSYYFYENGQPRPFPSTYTNPYGYNLLSKIDIIVDYTDGASATYSGLSINSSANNNVIA
jgi:hypothetical protein